VPAVKKRWITVDDRMQGGYRYAVTEPAGHNFAADFKIGRASCRERV